MMLSVMAPYNLTILTNIIIFYNVLKQSAFQLPLKSFLWGRHWGLPRFPLATYPSTAGQGTWWSLFIGIVPCPVVTEFISTLSLPSWKRKWYHGALRSLSKSRGQRWNVELADLWWQDGINLMFRVIRAHGGEECPTWANFDPKRRLKIASWGR